MGFNRRFRTITDASRYDADIVIACRGCRHTVVIDFQTIMAIVRDRRINPALEVAPGRFKCSRCYRRWPVIEITARGDSRTISLKDGDPLPPRGVSITAWIRGHAADRKRLIRMARG